MKPGVEIAAVMFSTTSQTRDRATNPADARKFFFAARAYINVAPRMRLRRERQIVTTRFIRDSKIDTGLSPLRAMRRDSSPPDPPLREQMRQFMPQRALDLVRARCRPLVLL